MVPDLLITYGGHIVSKRLKQFLRKHPPREHWHVSLSGEVTDLYGSLTTVIEMDPFEFLEKIAYLLENRTTEFPRIWENNTRDLPQPEFSYSEMAAIGTLIKSLPTPAALHLGNSSAVRYAQLYTLPEDVEVCCNRGTSGIEGSLSTAIGYSVCSDKLNFVVIGDLSFFYDMNALWNSNFGCNLRILLLNNGGGEIFQALPGLKMEDKTRRFVTATHKTSAKGWAKERGFSYLPVHNDEELTSAMAVFTQSAPHNQPMLMEVFTDASEDVRLLKVLPPTKIICHEKFFYRFVASLWCQHKAKTFAGRQPTGLFRHRLFQLVTPELKADALKTAISSTEAHSASRFPTTVQRDERRTCWPCPYKNYENGRMKKRKIQHLTETSTIRSVRTVQIALPKEIVLVKSTLNDEGGGRQLPAAISYAYRSFISHPVSDSTRNCCCETFHILTRNSLILRKNVQDDRIHGNR